MFTFRQYLEEENLNIYRARLDKPGHPSHGKIVTVWGSGSKEGFKKVREYDPKDPGHRGDDFEVHKSNLKEDEEQICESHEDIGKLPHKKSLPLYVYK